MKKILDKTFWLYVGLGILNYGFCSVIMLFFKNVVRLGDTPCLIISFTLQTSISFILNRFVTFRRLHISRYWPLLFVCSIAVCYVTAKVLLKKVFELLIVLPFFDGIVQWLFGLLKPQMAYGLFRENLVLLACTFTYCVINYVGHRYFVFRPVKGKPETRQA